MTAKVLGFKQPQPRAPRVWFYRPTLHWFGWRTLVPVIWGSDEWHSRDLCLGWNPTGQVVIRLWRFRDCDPDECVDFMCPSCGQWLGAARNGVWFCIRCESEDWDDDDEDVRAA